MPRRRRERRRGHRLGGGLAGQQQVEDDPEQQRRDGREDQDARGVHREARVQARTGGGARGVVEVAVAEQGARAEHGERADEAADEQPADRTGLVPPGVPPHAEAGDQPDDRGDDREPPVDRDQLLGLGREHGDLTGVVDLVVVRRRRPAPDEPSDHPDEGQPGDDPHRDGHLGAPLELRLARDRRRGGKRVAYVVAAREHVTRRQRRQRQPRRRCGRIRRTHRADPTRTPIPTCGGLRTPRVALRGA